MAGLAIRSPAIFKRPNKTAGSLVPEGIAFYLDIYNMEGPPLKMTIKTLEHYPPLYTFESLFNRMYPYL